MWDAWYLGRRIGMHIYEGGGAAGLACIYEAGYEETYMGLGGGWNRGCMGGIHL